MAYYDRLVRDPEAALGEIAERRNLSREELLSRLSAVRAAAQSGDHLTLGQAQSLFDDNQPPPPALAAHVDGCAYCQAMLDGLQPRRLEQGAERLMSELARTRGSSPLAVPAMVALARSQWLQPATAAALGFVLAVAVVARPVASYFSDSTELVELKAENAKLRGTVAALYGVKDASLEDRPWLAFDAFAQVSCDSIGSGADGHSLCVSGRESEILGFGLQSSGLQGEWKVVSAMPNTIGGTSLQLTRADVEGPKSSSVELTPGDKIVLLNLKKRARSDVPARPASEAASDSRAAADAARD